MTKSTTRFQKYPAYKDSGVEWLGEIPEGWEVKKITHVFNKIGSGTTPTSGDLKYYNGKYHFLQTGDLNDGKIFFTNRTIKEEAFKSFSSLKLYPKGSLVMAMYGATIGKLGILEVEAATNQACCVFIKSKKVRSDYFFYVLLGFRNEIISLGYGGGQPNISQDLIKSLRFPLPTLHEQTTIANFLDDKTAKIDQAIAQKEKLIALLKERKQIVIQQAVTGKTVWSEKQQAFVPLSQSGAEGKDSGVEWIGEIPAHWEVVRIKHLSDKITDGEHISPVFTDSGMPFLSAKDIRDGYISFPENKFVSLRDGKKFRLRCNPEIGDLLLVSRGATIGRVSIVDSEREFCLLGSVILIKPSKRIFNEYLVSAMRNEKLQDEFLNTSHHSAQQAIYLARVAEVYLPIPPNHEQSQVVKYLYEQGQKIDQSITLQQTQIEKLKEYKATLIDSAVTGKIKVN